MHLTVRVRISPADVDSYIADLRAIIERYGMGDDCPPHLRKERDAAIERADASFRQCIDVGFDA